MSSATVVHDIAGRMRIRVDGSPLERRRALDALEACLEGRGEVTANRRTGSALITYDQAVLDADAIIELLRDVDIAFTTLEPQAMRRRVNRPMSEVAENVQARFSRANRSVLVATDGRVDIRTLVPIALGGLALRQLRREGNGLRDAPWYVLAYYAFDTYVKLHADDVRGLIS